MKKVISIFTLTLLSALSCFNDGNAQELYDYNEDLYLIVHNIDNGTLCGYNNPNYQPGDGIQYHTHVWIDQYLLYNKAYRQDTPNGALTYWSTFGGYGHPTNPGKGFKGEIDDVKKTDVATGPLGVGQLKFGNVRIPGTSSSWGTEIWVNVFSQCHDQCSKGTWWKFEKNLNADEARQFATANKYRTSSDSNVNGTLVILSYQGQPSCDKTRIYGFGSGELN